MTDEKETPIFNIQYINVLSKWLDWWPARNIYCKIAGKIIARPAAVQINEATGNLSFVKEGTIDITKPSENSMQEICDAVNSAVDYPEWWCKVMHEDDPTKISKEDKDNFTKEYRLWFKRDD